MTLPVGVPRIPCAGAARARAGGGRCVLVNEGADGALPGALIFSRGLFATTCRRDWAC